jgi:hypothetical protein
MLQGAIHQCQCPDCLATQDHPLKKVHRLMNLLLNRLDEDHRRWYVALESLKLGHGGDRHLARITGLNVETIRRGRRELARSLEGFPAERIRRRGAGRPPLKKKTRRSPRT